MGWFTQSRIGDHEVQAKAGVSRAQDVPTSEFVFIDHSRSDGKHPHLVINEKGDTIYARDCTPSGSGGSGGGSGKDGGGSTSDGGSKGNPDGGSGGSSK